ncbi:SAG family member [Eimeria mitis]|uniref:SAG family member n=1 Tax=Eimeria mitis TaxID=44415 RepID=U6K1B1_9EIME|nr:SAG family member [Eimeria mitis]CDJ31459.1 SAG family member [Eimeria mitis]
MVTCGRTKSVDCLADFNAARERAGLEAFIAETNAEKKLPTSKTEYLAAICSAIQEASGLHLPYHCRVDTMRKLSSVLVVAAVLGAAHGVENGNSGQKGSAKSVDCLADFNAARDRAGLEAFIAETDAKKKLPTENEGYIAAICSAIQEASGLHLPYHCQSVDCLADFNAARERAGLEAFIAETDNDKKLSTGDETYIGKICSAIQEASDLHLRHHCRPADGCSAAVSYWKKAHVNFGELPAEYEEPKDVYADSQNVSLVALYNPKEGATLDCAYITCPISTKTTTAAPTTTSVSTTAATSSPSTSSSDGSGGTGGTGGNGGGGGGGGGGSSFFSAERSAGASASRDVQGRASAAAPIFYPVSREGDSGDPQRTGPSVRRLSTTSETVTGLVCLTNPAALVKGQKPFTSLGLVKEAELGEIFLKLSCLACVSATAVSAVSAEQQE